MDYYTTLTKMFAISFEISILLSLQIYKIIIYAYSQITWKLFH